MKTVFRFVAVAMTLVLCLGSLCSCGARETGSGPTAGSSAGQAVQAAQATPAVREFVRHEEEGDYRYAVYSDGTAWLREYYGNDAALTLPAEIGGYPVTYVTLINLENSGITSLTVPEGVQSICLNSFKDCTRLEHVELPSSIRHIDKRAFANTPWLAGMTDEFAVAGDGVLMRYNGNGGDIVLPDGIRVIAGGAFQEAEVQTVSMNEGLLGVSDYAFELQSLLRQVYIPDSVEYIGDGAFDYCTALEQVRLPANMPGIPDNLFTGCEALQPFALPDGIRYIGEYAFSECNQFTELEVPEGVVSIGTSAFGYCASLERVSLPQSLELIGQGAFSNTPWLEGQIAAHRLSEQQKNPAERSDFLLINNGKHAVGINTSELLVSYVPEGVLSADFTSESYIDALRFISVPEGVRLVSFYGSQIDNPLDIYIADPQTALGRIKDEAGNVLLHLPQDSLAEAYAIKNEINYVTADAGNTMDDGAEGELIGSVWKLSEAYQNGEAVDKALVEELNSSMAFWRGGGQLQGHTIGLAWEDSHTVALIAGDGSSQSGEFSEDYSSLSLDGGIFGRGGLRLVYRRVR